MFIFSYTEKKIGPILYSVRQCDFMIYSSESIAHKYLYPQPHPYQKIQSNISLLDRHHGQLAPHFSSFYLLNQRPHLLFTCYTPHHELFSARGKFTAPVFLQSGRKFRDGKREGGGEKRERGVRQKGEGGRERMAGGKWPQEGCRLTQATS